MKKKINAILYVCLACLSAAALNADGDVPSSDTDQAAVQQQVIIVPVSGEVGPAMAAFIERALEGTDDPDPLFILEMDTFGGRVDSAFQIVDTLLNVPQGRTLAFVEKKAISAGALIALACNELVMKPSTTIGDCAPIILSKEGPKMLGEKFQSPLRAKFRTLAKRNGYPEVLAEAMVSGDMVVYKVETDDGRSFYMEATEYEDLSENERKAIRSKKTVVGKDKLLTMDDQEAMEFGFSKMSVESVEEMLREKGITEYEITEIEENWSEQMVRLITMIAPILMLIGFAGLYLEMQTPGFGIPGILGIICLGLVFFGQYMVGLADHTELLLITLGILLLGVEMFVTPGFGLPGFAGITLMAVGMILSLQDFVLPSPDVPWEAELLWRNVVTVLGSFLGSALLIIIFFRLILPKLSYVIPGPFLSATLADSHVDSDVPVRVSVGDRGVVVKPLRPSGSARIGNDIYDVVSEGEFIKRGQAVVVLEMQGNRVVVVLRGAGDF